MALHRAFLRMYIVMCASCMCPAFERYVIGLICKEGSYIASLCKWFISSVKHLLLFELPSSLLVMSITSTVSSLFLFEVLTLCVCLYATNVLRQFHWKSAFHWHFFIVELLVWYFYVSSLYDILDLCVALNVTEINFSTLSIKYVVFIILELFRSILY